MSQLLSSHNPALSYFFLYNLVFLRTNSLPWVAVSALLMMQQKLMCLLVAFGEQVRQGLGVALGISLAERLGIS